MQHSPPAVSPPWTTLGRKIESAIRKAILTYNLVDNQKKVAIALSGGKDSLTLLYMLHAIQGKGIPPLELHAIHVSGSFSCGPGMGTDYLRRVCDNLNISLTLKESTQKLETLSCYPCSRERRKLLFEAAKERGCTTIAFGHHRDDNAETLLLNMLQKGECAGMLPKLEMYRYGVTIIRPMIFVPEEEIRSFAQQNQFTRIVCQCPVGQDSHRRKVKGFIEEIEAHFPYARLNLSHASLNYGSDKANKNPDAEI